MFLNFGDNVINIENITRIKRSTKMFSIKRYTITIIGVRTNMTLKFKNENDRDTVFNVIKKTVSAQDLDLTSLFETC